jgi:hypothetical protein
MTRLSARRWPMSFHFIAAATLATCLVAPVFAANRGGHLDLREHWAALTRSDEAINVIGTPAACQSDAAMSNGPLADRHLDRRLRKSIGSSNGFMPWVANSARPTAGGVQTVANMAEPKAPPPAKADKRAQR